MESVGNTTIQTLDASTSSIFDSTPHIFDGTPQNTSGYSFINTIINADHAGQLKVRHSMDATVWDITDTYTYPTTGVPLGTGLSTITPIKALYCNVQFVNTSDVSNNIRLQTLLTDGSIPRVLAGDTIDVCINHQPVRVTVENNTGGSQLSISGNVHIVDSSINVNVVNTKPITVSGDFHLTDTSINVNVVNPKAIAISGDVHLMDSSVNVRVINTKPISVSGDFHLIDTSINVNVVNVGPLLVKEVPSDLVWEGYEEVNNLIAGTASRIFTINATNFAPDYRYVKLYDSNAAPNVAAVKPRITIPLPPDLPQNIQLGSKGLKFPNGIYVRITRLYVSTDQNMSTAGDVGLTVIFETP
jgi:hypothetical protein